MSIDPRFVLLLTELVSGLIVLFWLVAPAGRSLLARRNVRAARVQFLPLNLERVTAISSYTVWI